MLDRLFAVLFAAMAGHAQGPCAAAQEADNTQSASQAEAAAPTEPQQSTVCTYETVEGSDVPERICRTVLRLRLVRLPTAAETPAATEESTAAAEAAPPQDAIVERPQP